MTIQNQNTLGLTNIPSLPDYAGLLGACLLPAVAGMNTPNTMGYAHAMEAEQLAKTVPNPYG